MATIFLEDESERKHLVLALMPSASTPKPHGFALAPDDVNEASSLQSWPSWRNCCLDPIPGIGAESLSEDSSSSGSSSSSSSRPHAAKRPRIADEAKREKAKKAKKWRLKFRVHERLLRELCPPASFELHEGTRKRHRSFVVVPKLLDTSEIELVHALWKHPSVEEIRDRKQALLYRHAAYRMELALRAHGQRLYSKLIDSMVWADAYVWERLSKNSVTYPEVEYIVYDARTGAPGTIEAHVDNHSAVTLVVLLSDESEFQGGVNCFANACQGDTPPRQVQLTQGDCVLFRGERLRHWITPVTAGLRVILQIELSRQ